jgi:diacylglycerol kinase family enzyme
MATAARRGNWPPVLVATKNGADIFMPNEPSQSEKRLVIVSVNPKAGNGSRGGRVERLVELLEQNRLDPVVLTNLDEVAERANIENNAGRLRALIGVGGDGTVTELANRIGPSVPLVMLPAGTENLLARHLGWSADPESLAKSIVNCRTTQIDAGRANGRLFLIMFSTGVDADVVRRVDQARGGHISHWTYAVPIIKSFFGFRFPELQIGYNGSQRRGIYWIGSFNVPRYGGGFRFAPEANPYDGRLDTCMSSNRGILRTAYFLWRVVRQTHLSMKKIDLEKIDTTFHVKTVDDTPADYQLDGDPGGQLPVKIEPVRKAITIVLPTEKC